jgi:flagellar biosynthetic protein FliR
LIPIDANAVLAVFLIFCRVGGCLMMAPGYSSNRIPARVRLFLALTVSLAVFPLLSSAFPKESLSAAPFALFTMIGTELVMGVLIGLLGRIYFFALQTLINGAALAIGFGSIPGAPIDEAEPLPALSSLIMMVATALVFMLDLHQEILKGVVRSYEVFGPGQWLGPRLSVVRIVDQTTAAFLLTLRITAPFIVYSVVVNLAVGLANKIMPQIPIFFIATPFIMVGGLAAFYFLVPEVLTMFMEAFKGWVLRDSAL